jgi:hypothetical protein
MLSVLSIPSFPPSCHQKLVDAGFSLRKLKFAITIMDKLLIYIDLTSITSEITLSLFRGSVSLLQWEIHQHWYEVRIRKQYILP